MKKLILTTLAISGLMLGLTLVSTVSVNSGKALAKEVELRHGADDVQDVNDDHRGRGRGGDDLARRGQNETEHGVEVEKEHGVEIETQG